jgi:hypothetical protein
VITDRDLTKQEFAFYKDQADASRIVFAFPLWVWAKFLNDTADGGLFMERLFYFPGIPVLAPGLRYARGATFDPEGKQDTYFGMTGFEPLFSYMYCDVKTGEHRWEGQLKYTRILGNFGFGKCRDEAIVKIIFHFGASAREIRESSPLFSGFREKYLK